jgi:hypothetical protein
VQLGEEGGSVYGSTGGVELTGEDRSIRGITSPSATLSTPYPTRTNPGSNPRPRGACSVTVAAFASKECTVLLMTWRDGYWPVRGFSL